MASHSRWDGPGCVGITPPPSRFSAPSRRNSSTETTTRAATTPAYRSDGGSKPGTTPAGFTPPSDNSHQTNGRTTTTITQPHKPSVQHMGELQMRRHRRGAGGWGSCVALAGVSAVVGTLRDTTRSYIPSSRPDTAPPPTPPTTTYPLPDSTIPLQTQPTRLRSPSPRFPTRHLHSPTRPVLPRSCRSGSPGRSALLPLAGLPLGSCRAGLHPEAEGRGRRLTEIPTSERPYQRASVRLDRR